MTHFGYWVFGKDMTNINLTKLKNNGVTDIFLNFYAFTTHGESKVLSWIKNAKANKIDVHIWIQCFYDGEWHNPKTTNLTSKLKEIKKYANLNNVKGVHLDYLRYPGNAYKTSGGADAITAFVKKVRSQNPKTFLSCAVMPEQSAKYYYGQDIDALGKIVDAILPMQYKGNYGADTVWLESTSKLFSSKATLWSGLQSYKSDDDTTKLSNSELSKDIKACLNNGASGVILFRYGMSTDINFKSFQPSTTTKKSDKMTTLSTKEVYNIAKTIKQYVEKNKKFPSSITVNNKKYTWGQCAYILSYAINHLTGNLPLISSKNAPKSTGAKINEKIYPSDYRDQAKRITNYIKQKGVCPNYVTTVKSKTKVRPRDFIYAFAKIIVWYNTHNKVLPSYCTYNSGVYGNTTNISSSSGLKDYMTSQGCAGMGQCTGYNCACNSLQQSFYRLTGIKVAESTIASWAGTTTSGTGHPGIETAVAAFNKKYNKKVKIQWYNFSELGWSKLAELMKKGAVFFHLLYRNQWGHYEVIKAIDGNNLKILNSLGEYCGYPAYCGYIENRSKETQQSYINGISQKSVAYLYNG